jgi:RNA polymerase primary sigma factor
VELTTQEVRDIRAADQSPTSLDRSVGDEDSGTALGDLIADDADGPDRQVEEELGVQTVQRVVNELPSPERDVLTLRFGIGGKDVTDLRETGRRLGISGESVRKIENRALRRLADSGELAALREAA